MCASRSCVPLASNASLSIYSCDASVPCEIYTLSLHDALPIFDAACDPHWLAQARHLYQIAEQCRKTGDLEDRKSTRLNSSHTVSSYAVFCWKKQSRRIFP